VIGGQVASTHHDGGGEWSRHLPALMQIKRDLQKSVTSGGLTQAMASVTPTTGSALKSASVLLYIYGKHITTPILKQDLKCPNPWQKPTVLVCTMAWLMPNCFSWAKT